MTTKQNTQPLTENYAYQVLAALPKGTTIFTIVRHVSKSGMQRTIAAFVMIDGEPRYLTPIVYAEGSGFKPSSAHDGFKVNGCGMDMAWHLVYSLGIFVHGNGDHFTNRTL